MEVLTLALPNFVQQTVCPYSRTASRFCILGTRGYGSPCLHVLSPEQFLPEPSSLRQVSLAPFRAALFRLGLTLLPLRSRSDIQLRNGDNYETEGCEPLVSSPSNTCLFRLL